MKDFWKLSTPIKQQIEAQFGQPIRYSKDCESLARHLSVVCRESISPTTLKRLFGFAKPIARPRLYTLDVLANYIGFGSWKQLEENGSLLQPAPPNEDVHLLQQELVVLRNLKRIELDHVVELCERFGHHEAIFPFLINLIHLAFQWNDTVFLKKVFDLPKIYTHSEHDILNIYYIGQTIGTSLREYPHATDLLEAYGRSTTAQRYFIEWFVDEDYLEGYYGKLLDVYAKYTQCSESNKLFYYLLKAKQAYQTNQIAVFESYYASILAAPKPHDLHEILAARYIAVCALKNDLTSLEPAYQAWLKRYVTSSTFEHAIGFVFYLSREFFEQKRHDFLAELLDLFDRKFSNSSPQTHWSAKINRQLAMYKAFVAHSNGQIAEAKKHLAQVDPFLFDSFLFGPLSRHFEEVCLRILGNNRS